MNGNTFAGISLLIGIIVGTLIAVIIVKNFHTDHKFRTEYDERQKIIRGDSYRFGFFAMLFADALICILSTFIDFPMVPLVSHFLAIAIGITVQAGYSIWKGAYIGQNTKTMRFVVIMVFIALFNFFLAAMAIITGRMFVDGKLQFQALNLICGLMFVAIGLVALVRNVTSRESEVEI